MLVTIVRVTSNAVGAGLVAWSVGFMLAATAAEPAPGDGPPLPVHTIEGGGGAAITPIAYLVNPGPANKAPSPDPAN